MQKKPLTEKEFKSIYSKVPRLTVEVILMTEKGLILTKRSIEPYIGMWHIPGGTVYYKERLEQALNRIALEELGVKVDIDKFVGFIYYPNLIRDFGWDTPIGAAFLTTLRSGKLRGSYQGEELGYFDALPDNIVPSQGEFLANNKILLDKD
jgi:8-oxo-dGTP pyrophosphatase MutT (NUDIX family)